VEAQELKNITKATPAARHSPLMILARTNPRFERKPDLPPFCFGFVESALNVFCIATFYPEPRPNATGLCFGFGFMQEKSPLGKAGFLAG
jgi:hypothetical protein